ncbi:MAG: META domain-containing protein [Halothiobacillaceae bacterium]
MITAIFRFAPMRLSASLLPALLLSGCASDPVASVRQATTEATFLCGVLEVDARFSQERLALTVADQTYRLDQVISGSGARYLGKGPGNQAVEFWNRGDEATLTVGSQAYPRCVTASLDEVAGYRALGVEPDWSWTLGPGEAVLRLPHERRSFSAPRSVVREGPDGWLMPAADGPVEIRRSPGPCNDTMSERIYPDQVVLSFEDRQWRGCGTDPAGLLQVTAWQLVDRDGASVPADVQITMALDPEGRVAGKSACNRYFGRYRLADGKTLVFGPLASSRMTCPGPIMDWEQAYLAHFEGPLRFSIDERGRLELVDSTGVRLTFRPRPAAGD